MQNGSTSAGNNATNGECNKGANAGEATTHERGESGVSNGGSGGGGGDEGAAASSVVVAAACSRRAVINSPGNVCHYVEWFNQLTALVATEVLRHSRKRHRVKCIEFFVECARECCNIGNFK